MRKDLRSEINAVVLAGQNGHSACIKLGAALLTHLDQLLEQGSLSGDDWAEAGFIASSVLINFSEEKLSKPAAALGVRIADRAIEVTENEPLRRNLEYNAANGRVASHKLKLPASPSSTQYVASRLEDASILMEARVLYDRVGRDRSVALDLRGRALCNLANTLDDSGRWVEAYQTYLDALDADSTNGNASGNAAELLRRRMQSGRGALGHYAVVHDAFVQHSQAHRARTVELAGTATADRWDAAELLGGQGHLAHSGDPLDDYQRWIKDHRFALTLAVDGLGTDDPRWDSATIASLHVTSAEIPPIYASTNVLKAEFLVSRRLAFAGETRLREALFGQSPDDSGIYVDTLNMAVYGEASSSLVLAQRTTLDLLDKVAVAANEHFEVNDDPEKVTFRSFWARGNPVALRPQLPTPASTYTPTALSLAELAFDFDGGLYGAAQSLRNAGTHRLVNLSWAENNAASNGTHVEVSYERLLEASHLSLAVARAAFLYLLDMVADEQDGNAGKGQHATLPLFIQD